MCDVYVVLSIPVHVITRLLLNEIYQTLGINIRLDINGIWFVDEMLDAIYFLLKTLSLSSHRLSS